MTSQAVARRPRIFAFLPAFLFDTGQPAWLYVLKAWPLVLLPSLALSALVGLAMPTAEQPDLGTGDAVSLVVIVLFAPIVETLLMAGGLKLLGYVLRPPHAAIASALGWGVLHSLAAPIWGLVVWWPFLIFSIAYLTWREIGLWRAVMVASSIHILQNLVPAVALAVMG